MSLSLPSTQRWLAIRTHFALDGLIFFAALAIAVVLRFGDDWETPLKLYLPSALPAAFALPAMIYVMGLYSLHGLHLPRRQRIARMGVGVSAAFGVLLLIGAFDFSSRVGRGVLAIQVPLTLTMLALHHGGLVRRGLKVRRRVAILLWSQDDAKGLAILRRFHPTSTELVGYFSPKPLDFAADLEWLGNEDAMVDRMEQRSIGSLICGQAHLHREELSVPLRRICFSGIPVHTMVDVLEEAYGAVPLSLVNMEWLVKASSMPRRQYALKMKRLFDIACALVFGIALSPLLLFGLGVVAVTSRGPLFYTQRRCGKHGRVFSVLKLRTMRVDAEKTGAKWAAGRKDPRLTPLGGLLRTFRIDEIPQLWNVLRGDMSFVGPRPERPEFMTELTEAIPFFEERLLVQPGLTGWAQVCYPYGASIEDAKRKLEYDLYYMKHMSLLLDLFILLDTARTVLLGGAPRRGADVLQAIDHLSGTDDPLVTPPSARVQAA